MKTRKLHHTHQTTSRQFILLILAYNCSLAKAINKLTVPDIGDEHSQTTHPIPFRDSRHFVHPLLTQ